ncbi:alcohol dehydrogenase catalytic domain-containing protein [Hespellia stercorisuis]|uniref:L-iditol 2-dehydrogenase n=1 Tax=Hespellia stercorisuis DSM 15480 TaxID=1121950 RepID=A0A1M6J744_9FIRM|nr:alcohol dehydrogenase catalytic domain-containing protein [Hespellia stercorisuis]SHJ42491.1 L-iditol 2-dehydrogenase [Hespellia stercorisuis DSM 15480]
MVEGKMKVCVLTGKQKLEWAEYDIPQAGPGELQIKLEYVGVCGSDLHFYQEGCLANWTLDGPLALGHEPGGVVTGIGEGVEGFAVGDKISIEPAVPCGKCEDCRKGNYNLCKDIKMLAIPGERDGVNAEYCVHDASMCYKLPEGVSTMAGGLIEPLAVGMHATELSNAKIGESAIVLGSGCIGLCTIMSLKARGVSEIYVADVMDKRLEKAMELGATRVFNSRNESIEEFAKTLPGGGVDQVYECAGNRITTLQSCRLIKRAGKVTLVGVSPEPVLELDIATLNAMEGTVYSVYRYRNLWDKAIKAVASGDIPVEKVVSHIFAFDDCIHAIQYSLEHKDEVIKAVVSMVDKENKVIS